MAADEPKVARYEQYMTDVKADIGQCIEEMGCQPILFVGSGLSKRYFSGPSWDELLSYLAQSCPLIDKKYTYYKQFYKDPLKIGEEFANLYQAWAWAEGNSSFPKDLFADGIPSSIYIKYQVSQYLKSTTPSSLDPLLNGPLRDEIKSLKNITPHAIITTNYDQFLELVFPEYEPVVGQKIIQGFNLSFGEIFKIHGCVSDPIGLVLTESDYTMFTRKKKYLSAKLLTFFSEHPLLFIGYSAGDPNIRAILSDIDEALPIAGGIIRNVYILEWRQKIASEVYPGREKLIAIDDSKSVRVNSIETDDFGWVFEAFGARPTLNRVSPKTLRALLSRSYELVRHDIPRRAFEADFQMLEHAVNNQTEFAKLFGITTISDPTALAGSTTRAPNPFALQGSDPRF